MKRTMNIAYKIIYNLVVFIEQITKHLSLWCVVLVRCRNCRNCAHNSCLFSKFQQFPSTDRSAYTHKHLLLLSLSHTQNLCIIYILDLVPDVCVFCITTVCSQCCRARECVCLWSGGFF